MVGALVRGHKTRVQTKKLYYCQIQMLSVYSNTVPVKLAHGREARPVIDDRQRDACHTVCLKLAKAACEPGITVNGIYLPEDVVDLIADWVLDTPLMVTLQCVSWSFRSAFWPRTLVTCSRYSALHVAVSLGMQASPTPLQWWDTEHELSRMAFKFFRSECRRIKKESTTDASPSRKRSRDQ